MQTEKQIPKWMTNTKTIRVSKKTYDKMVQIINSKSDSRNWSFNKLLTEFLKKEVQK